MKNKSKNAVIPVKTGIQKKAKLDEWREVKLGDVADIKSGKRNSQDAVEHGEYPLFDRSQVVKKSNQYLFDTVAVIVAGEGQEFIPRYYQGKFDLHQRTYAIFNFSDSVESKYIYYYLLFHNKYFASVAVGSTVLSLRLNHFENFPVLLPSIPEQKAIAEILSSLDDKIDLLHCQNKTLENMAQTLFRKWFVEDAEDEWKTGKVSDLIQIQSGFAFKSSHFVDNAVYRLVTIKNVQNGYLDLAKTNYLEEIPEKTPDYCLLKRGDILLSLTGNVGRCCIVTEENLLLNQRVAKLQAKEKRNWVFTYIFFRQTSMRRMLEDMAKGTAQSNLSPIETANIEIQIPTSNILQKFHEITNPLLGKVLENKFSIRTLENLRDILLPKLMSGKASTTL